MATQVRFLQKPAEPKSNAIELKNERQILQYKNFVQEWFPSKWFPSSMTSKEGNRKHYVLKAAYIIT